MKAVDIELAIANHFNPRMNVIVPNVSWGWGLRYEADLVVLRPSGYAAEVEIKVTASDIKADQKKGHSHDSNRFRELWFAVPMPLAQDQNIPLRAGVLAVCHDGTVKTIRGPKLNKSATKADSKQMHKLMALGCMRIWTLKTKLAAKQRTRP